MRWAGLAWAGVDDGGPIKTTAWLSPRGIAAFEELVLEAKRRARAAGRPTRATATAKQVWLALGDLVADDPDLRQRLLDTVTPHQGLRHDSGSA